MERACINCKHHYSAVGPITEEENHLCRVQIFNPVYGKLTNTKCFWARTNEAFCGIGGKWFEQAVDH